MYVCGDCHVCVHICVDCAVSVEMCVNAVSNGDCGSRDGVYICMFVLLYVEEEKGLCMCGGRGDCVEGEMQCGSVCVDWDVCVCVCLHAHVERMMCVCVCVWREQIVLEVESVWRD